MGPDVMILVFWMLSFKPVYDLNSRKLMAILWDSEWDLYLSK